MDANQREQLRRQLLEQREELQAREAAASEAVRPVKLDQASVGRLSRMDAMQMQAMAQEEQRRRGVRLQRIEQVLERLDDEDFGLCEDCDEAIAPGRLALDPTTALCIRCASARETAG